MTMTVRELRMYLEAFDEDDEVRIAHQPTWPFEYSVGQVVQVYPDAEDIVEEYGLAEDDWQGVESADPIEASDGVQVDKIAYIAEGTQLGYLPGCVTKELGWGRDY